MEQLGIVRELSHTGLLVVRGRYAPAIGSKVLDRSKRPIGVVKRIFGPVERPYLSVRPKTKDTRKLMRLIGATVYQSS